jgi:hypothetical protein
LAKFDEGPLFQRAFRFLQTPRVARRRDCGRRPTSVQPHRSCRHEKHAATRSIVAKSALYTVGYHGIPDAAVQHTKRKNRLK